MKTQDRYLQFVRWEEDDGLYVGYCPDLFPYGGVCHGETAVEAYTRLTEAVDDMITTALRQGIELPPPRTRPMRDAIPA